MCVDLSDNWESEEVESLVEDGEWELVRIYNKRREHRPTLYLIIHIGCKCTACDEGGSGVLCGFKGKSSYTQNFCVAADRFSSRRARRSNDQFYKKQIEFKKCVTCGKRLPNEMRTLAIMNTLAANGVINGNID